jgi:hypothetical protein
MQSTFFLNFWIGLILITFSCQNPSHKHTNTMITSSVQPVAQWSATKEQQPINFLYQGEDKAFVTYQQGYLHLAANASVTEHTLDGVAELVQLQPWNNQYLLLAFDEATYSNVAYQVEQLQPLSKQLIEGLEDPKDIAYSSATALFYYKHSSVRLYSFNPVDQTNTALLPEREVSELAISDNGLFLALENSEEIVVVNTNDYSLVQQYAVPSGSAYDLVGITNAGSPVVVQHATAEKNTTEEARPEVLLLQKDTPKLLTSTSEGWARWHKGHLMVLDQKTFKLYDSSILE